MPDDLISRWFGPSAKRDAVPPAAEPRLPAADAGGRRTRDVVGAAQEVQDRLSAKILHGWLLNRHQTLMPLHVNLARLDVAQREVIAAFGGLAAELGGDPGAWSRVEAWLRAAGADPETLSVFGRSRSEAASLPALLAKLGQPALAGLAYVVALVAAQNSGPPAKAFAEFVGVRLGLSTAALRSAERRYRS